MKTPLISVVMPVFNGAEHLPAAVESILRQTVGDLEFIIIDDGSQDDSGAVLRAFARQDQRIRLVSRENRGVSASLNEGIALARGTWIARMDADDISSANRFAVQLDWLRRTGADVCGGWITRFRGPFQRTCRYPVSHDTIIRSLPLLTPFVHPTVIARRELLRKIPYGTESCGQDYALWLALAGEGARFANAPQVVLRYRVHHGQVSFSQRRQQGDQARVARREFLGKCHPDGSSLAGAIEALFNGELGVSEIAALLDRLFAGHTIACRDRHERFALRDLLVRAFRNAKDSSLRGYAVFRDQAMKRGAASHDPSLFMQMLVCQNRG